jgi:AhpD family alkylhydroperoxidase
MSHARSEYTDFQKLAPDAFEIVSSLGKVAAKAGLDKQLLELIKLRASQINGCAFCVQYHILQAETLGVPTDKINLVVVWREAPQFSPGERAALAWTEEFGVLRAGARLSHLGRGLDQCLESLWSRLPLDPAGTEEDRQRRGVVRREQEHSTSKGNALWVCGLA